MAHIILIAFWVINATTGFTYCDHAEDILDIGLLNFTPIPYGLTQIILPLARIGVSKLEWKSVIKTSSSTDMEDAVSINTPPELVFLVYSLKLSVSVSQIV
jgi:hypothetical protein